MGEGLHFGEFLVGLDIAIWGGPRLPGVVDVDVDVAGVLHAARYHGGGDLADNFVVNAAVEMVPTVPAHGRSPGEAVVGERVDGRQVRLGKVREGRHGRRIVRFFLRRELSGWLIAEARHGDVDL